MTKVAPISSGFAAQMSTNAAALLTALAYADLFDYPLSLSELARFQAGSKFSEAVVAKQVRALLARGQVSEREGFFCLAGRESIFAVRAEREQASAKAWKRASFYAPVLARVPFVRMIAVTGALAMNNLGDRPDIDLMVLAKPGRVWICRRFLIALVRIARLFGDDLCPNYILSLSRLELEQRDFFTAHELAQMVPICGKQNYRSLLRSNTWAAEYLPAAFGISDRRKDSRFHRLDVPRGRTLAERFLSLAVFDRWERWEMERLGRKLHGQAKGDIGSSEVVCTPEQCKGHTGSHRRSILMRLTTRLEELDLSGNNPSD